MGIPIKPFEPRVTGRYNYEQRLEMIQKFGADIGPVELPGNLKPGSENNYIPMVCKMEGYSHMPRGLAPPYQNQKLQTSIDFVKKQRAKKLDSLLTRDRRNNITLEPINNRNASQTLDIDTKPNVF